MYSPYETWSALVQVDEEERQPRTASALSVESWALNIEAAAGQSANESTKAEASENSTVGS
jgi:hypothetical protein